MAQTIAGDVLRVVARLCPVGTRLALRGSCAAVRAAIPPKYTRPLAADVLRRVAEFTDPDTVNLLRSSCQTAARIVPVPVRQFPLYQPDGCVNMSRINPVHLVWQYSTAAPSGAQLPRAPAPAAAPRVYGYTGHGRRPVDDVLFNYPEPVAAPAQPAPPVFGYASQGRCLFDDIFLDDEM